MTRSSELYIIQIHSVSSLIAHSFHIFHEFALVDTRIINQEKSIALERTKQKKKDAYATRAFWLIIKHIYTRL